MAGRGGYVLLDDHYGTVARIAAGGGYSTDMHDLQLARAGTASVGAYHTVSVPGAGRVIDWVMRELDIATGRVDHVPLGASYAPGSRGRPWDHFHGNSIQPPRPGGHIVVVSSRNTSAIYGIDRRTGAVRWILGGRHDQFGVSRMPGRRCCGQHDARRLHGGDITVRLDLARRTARLVGDIPSGPSAPRRAGLFPTCVRSARRDRGGDTLIDWGSTGYISDVAAGGRLRFVLRIEPWSYRAVAARWVGRPAGEPTVLARSGSHGWIRVWAAWNGATLIDRWQLSAGPPPSAPAPVGRPFHFTGLETRAGIRAKARYVAVTALDAHGRALGTFEPVVVR